VKVDITAPLTSVKVDVAALQAALPKFELPKGASFPTFDAPKALKELQAQVQAVSTQVQAASPFKASEAKPLDLSALQLPQLPAGVSTHSLANITAELEAKLAAIKSHLAGKGAFVNVTAHAEAAKLLSAAPKVKVASLAAPKVTLPSINLPAFNTKVAPAAAPLNLDAALKSAQKSATEVGVRVAGLVGVKVNA